MVIDNPLNLGEQITKMGDYINISNVSEFEKFVSYTGYYRASIYGKFLASHSYVFGFKPDHSKIIELYKFDSTLRKLLFSYCKEVEIRLKSNVSNAIAINTNDPAFHSDLTVFQPTRGANSPRERNRNRHYFNNNFWPTITRKTNLLKTEQQKYPELSMYRNHGNKSHLEIPSWIAFSYFEFGVVTSLFSYLTFNLKRITLLYSYSRASYGRLDIKLFQSWLEAIKNLRNICSHHNILIGRNSSIINIDRLDSSLNISTTDLFSRIYALKKVLTPQTGTKLLSDLKQLIDDTDLDILACGTLPVDWHLKLQNVSAF